MPPYALRPVVILALGAILLGVWSGTAFAGPANPSLTLTLGQSSIAFLDSSPDLVPLVPSTPALVPVTVRVVGNAQQEWRLTIVASDHLRSGPDTITAGHVTWIASALPFVNGSLAVSTPQVVASGTGNVNPARGDLSFYLTNSWLFAPGTYSTTATFTLSAP